MSGQGDGEERFPRVFFWNENFATGFDEIDRQHRGLIELINRLPALSAGVPGAPALAEVLSNLRSYVAVHFSTEESLWEKLPHEGPLAPLLSYHEEEHRDFAKKVAEMGRSTEPGEVGEIVHFLTHWLARHILESDRRMAFVFKGVEKGLSPGEALAEAERDLDLTAAFTRTVLSMYDQVVDQALRLMEEISRRKTVEGSLRLLGQVFESVRDGILLLDSDGTIVDANPSFCRRLHGRREDLVGRSIFASPVLFDPEILSQAIREAMKMGHFSGTIRALRNEGEPDTLWVSLSPVYGKSGEKTHMTAIFSPVSELLEENEVLSEAANMDPLTEIPNRRLFNDRFGRAIRETASGRHRGALILLDLDRFKALNDLRGHPAGDEVLRETARRLRESVRQSDTVARLGGDEFAVLLGGLHPEGKVAALEARAAAEKVRLSLARPFDVSHLPGEGGGGLFRHLCPPSIGVALFGGEDHEEEPEIFEAADRALYRAKRAGGNTVVMAGEGLPHLAE
jgi:diguanylate cyclase (GGDEF)-like protein/hemerythrin-like metal-binding protein/PAS domain S-box-containing protein